MNIILDLIKQRNFSLISLLGAGVLGLLLGLAIGWWWWPVSWTNTTPANLRSDFQKEYVLWVAEEYADNGDLEQARQRLGASFWKKGQLDKTLGQLEQAHEGQQRLDVRKLARDLEAAEEGRALGGKSIFRPIMLVCGVGILIIAFVGGGFYLFTRWSEAEKAPAEVAKEAAPPSAEEPPSPEKVSWKGNPPQAQFVTTYTLGDDHYDPSFSIETEEGAFMGECGVGISETIGTGDPDKVTALEVWLFDKNDIRTVTKVLMSDYAFHDEALKTKLAPKGEPVLVEKGDNVVLETRGLRLRARIIEVEYGAGNLPKDSFFKQLKVELAAWINPDVEQKTPSVELGAA